MESAPESDPQSANDEQFLRWVASDHRPFACIRGACFGAIDTT
jgi:hypothetical protein